MVLAEPIRCRLVLTHGTRPANAPHLYKPEDYDFSLKPDSAAIDRGVELPTITDGFTGRAPDLGALEKPAAPGG